MCQHYFVPNVWPLLGPNSLIDSCLMLRACTPHLGVIAYLLMWSTENTDRHLRFGNKRESKKVLLLHFICKKNHTLTAWLGRLLSGAPAFEFISLRSISPIKVLVVFHRPSSEVLSLKVRFKIWHRPFLPHPVDCTEFTELESGFKQIYILIVQNQIYFHLT